MDTSKQIKVPAFYMRGGTSKGVFYKLDDLPLAAKEPGKIRDALLLRVIGSPDPYEKHIDGMGGATSSTSKSVILSASSKKNHDVDYLFGQIAIDQGRVDWSGNCGNLSAAVGAFAIHQGLIAKKNRIKDGIQSVRIWQKNINKTIIAHVPVAHYEVVECGDFYLDGVAFPSQEIIVDFLEPAGDALFPTANLTDILTVPKLGNIEATLINAGIPTAFVRARDINLTGTELQTDINQNPSLLNMFEELRAHAAIKMGLISDIEQAKTRQHTPKIAFVAEPADYQSSSGESINANDINLLARALSMGKLHHAMMGTASVALASAAVIPGTIVHEVSQKNDDNMIQFGHPSGLLKIGATAQESEGSWHIEKVSMSRSARVLMEGKVHIPEKTLNIG